MGIKWQPYVLNFEELPICFPKWLHHFTFPWTMHEGSNLSTSSPTLIIICLFNYSHPICCKWYLIVIWINDEWFWAWFQVFTICISFIYSNPLPIFKLFFIKLQEFFICSRNKSLVKYMICKYLFPFCGLHFALLVTFEMYKILILMKSNLQIFTLLLMLCYHL